jgi:type II secretion system protein H
MVYSIQLHQRARLHTSSSASDTGFSLIEMLVVVTIMSIVLMVAVLVIPNHDARYWRENLDQLVASLNLAQEESSMSGIPILVQLDSVGWRFSTYTPNGVAITPMSGDTKTFMPDVYSPKAWYKPVDISPTQITLGGEALTETMQIPITQELRQAVLARSRNGRFSWSAGVI